MRKGFLLAFFLLVFFGGKSQTVPSDYFRSFATGDWNVNATWESSPNGLPGSWIAATLTPTFLANTILIQNSHTVTLNASETIDQVEIQSGGILINDMPALNVLTINDGSGDDIVIKSGGIYQVLSSEQYTDHLLINPGATIHIEGGGVIQIGNGGGGLGGGNSAYASTSTSFIWDDASVFDWNTSIIPGIQVTFFPDAGISTVPIFRFSNATAPIGGGLATIINGRFESSVAVTFAGAGTKTFRNGIINSALIDQSSSGQFMITGGNGDLGGAGGINAPAPGLRIGPGSAVSLTADKTITGNVVLFTVNSLIYLGNFDLTVSGTVSNTDISSFIFTNATGVLTLNSVGAIGKLFPIGSTTINPIYIISPTTANYSARVVQPIAPPIYNDVNAVLRAWYISSTATSPNASISFGYSYPGDCGAGYSNSGPVEVGVNVAGVWNIHQTGLIPTAFPIVSGTFIVTPTIPINIFNGTTTEFPFVIANNGSILPVDYFITAQAQKINNTSQIKWKIADIDQVNRFIVERSVNNVSWQLIATVNPVANRYEYNYADAALSRGVNLYRIRVERRSGGTRYSNTVAVINDTKGLLITSVVPNPVQSEAQITISAAQQSGAEFKIYDLSGKLVKKWYASLNEGNTVIPVDFSTLLSGLYHLSITSPDAHATYRFIKH